MISQSIGAYITIVVLVILSAYFSATETAFTSLNRIKMKNIEAEGNKRATLVLSLVDNYERLLSAILIGNNIVNIGLAALGTLICVELFGEYGASVSTIAITIIVLIFGEVTPKTVAKEAPEEFSMFSAPILKAIMWITAPITFLFSKWQKLVSKILKIKNREGITQEEIKTLVEEAETEGGIEAERSQLIQNAIDFDHLTAVDVITPRVDVVAIDVEATEKEVAKIFKETGYSRIPIYEEDMDNIIGIVNQKDFHNRVVGTNKTIADIVKPVVYVPETTKLAILLKKMQTMKLHIAIVVDEYGGTEGIVTLEDMVEELVGEIFDEHDVIVSQEVTELQNGSYRIMGNAHTDKVFDFLGIELNEDLETSTINGWIVEMLDRLPKRDDRFETEIGDKKLIVRVTKSDGLRAIEINLRLEQALGEYA
ncbi:MAG: HlyC/CorC family transporter [Anaerovoracaceae bacterium]